MASDDVGDDVGDDGGDRDDGGNDAGDSAGEGDGRDAGGEGGGAPGGGHGGGCGDGGGGGCILQGLLLFIVKIFLCDFFMMCGGNWRGHTSPHTYLVHRQNQIRYIKRLSLMALVAAVSVTY
jgi:hypothetical protein